MRTPRSLVIFGGRGANSTSVQQDFNRFETLARMRGEKGVSPLMRKLALAALDAFEVG